MKKIIIALDGMSKDDALTLAENTAGLVWGYKVHELLLREGCSLIHDLKRYGNVFADFKFHDVPTTVGHEVAALAEHGADLITVHASGGGAMLAEAVKRGGEKIAAVTVLTSLSHAETETLFHASLKETVHALALSARSAGIKNIVCSPFEIDTVKTVAPNTTVITPGIRNTEDMKEDQERTQTAREALNAGADLLVIGRPITKAPHPRAALEAILATLA